MVSKTTQELHLGQLLPYSERLDGVAKRASLFQSKNVLQHLATVLKEYLGKQFQASISQAAPHHFIEKHLADRHLVDTSIT